jgi:WD domain, G-beta repeat
MSGQELYSCLQTMIDQHSSIVEFKHELYQIAIRLNHSSEYYAVSNTICEEIDKVYDDIEFKAATAKLSATNAQAPIHKNQRTVRLQIQAATHPARVACEILLPGHSPIQTTLHLSAAWAVAYQNWQAQYQQPTHKDRLPRAWQASASLLNMLEDWYHSNEWQSLRQQINSFVPTEAPLQIVLSSADLPHWQWQWLEEPVNTPTPEDISFQPEALLGSESPQHQLMAASQQAVELPQPVAPLEYHNLMLIQHFSGYYSEVRALGINLDQGIIVSAHSDINGQDNSIKVWQINDGSQIKNLSGHSDLVRALVLTTDGLRAYSAGFDKKILGWDLTTGKPLLFEVATEVAVTCLALTIDEKKLITGHSNGQIKIWDSHSGQFLTSWFGHTEGISNLAITDQLLATVGEDGIAMLWNIHNGDRLQQFTGHGGQITQVAIEAQGQQLITAGIDRTVRIWDTKTGEAQHLLVGHERPINALLLTPDGRSVISGSDDKTIKIWQLADGQLINSLGGHDTPVMALATAGKLLVSGGYGEIRLWGVS